MNLDHAVAAMTHDTWPVEIVRGLDKAQLESRFGYVVELDRAAPYLQACYTKVHAVGELGVHSNDKGFFI